MGAKGADPVARWWRRRPAVLVYCVAAILLHRLWPTGRPARLRGATVVWPGGVPRLAAYCNGDAPSGADTVARSPAGDGGPNLVAVTVVLRHGARSAIHAPPLARPAAFDCRYSPPVAAKVAAWEAKLPGLGGLAPEAGADGACRPGQLLERGFEQHAALGAALRNRYGGGWRLALARSTPYQRTTLSALAFLDGFFGGAGDEASVLESRSDPAAEPMFGVEGESGRGLPCPAGVRAAAAQRDAWANGAQAERAVVAALPTLDVPFQPCTIADAHLSTACETEAPLCVVNGGAYCLGRRSGDALLELADGFYAARFAGGDGGTRAAALGAHPLLSEILADLRDSGGRDERRLRVYVGHDTAPITPLLSALGIFDGRWPPLASRIVFEAYDDGSARILFNGKDVTTRVAGCPRDRVRCPLTSLDAAAAALLGGAASFEAACAAP